MTDEMEAKVIKLERSWIVARQGQTQLQRDVDQIKVDVRKLLDEKIADQTKAELLAQTSELHHKRMTLIVSIASILVVVAQFAIQAVMK